LGGTIHLLTNNTAAESFAKSNTTYRSFGLLKQSFSGGFAQERSSVYANYIHLQVTAFRQNSSYDRKSVHLQAKQQISSSGSLSFWGLH
jgi:iron complex outermembrane receptor protein